MQFYICGHTNGTKNFFSADEITISTDEEDENHEIDSDDEVEEDLNYSGDKIICWEFMDQTDENQVIYF